MTTKEDKASVRAKMRKLQINQDVRATGSASICNRLTALTFWHASDTVLLFAPLQDEPDVFLLPQKAKRFCYPRYNSDRGYEAATANDRSELSTGKFGILEPSPDAIEVAASEVDIIVVPGMAFDKNCYRLGRGHGFYDQWLVNLSGVKIGVGFDHQLIDCVPQEAHDVKLDGVIVPSRSVGAV
jgi:5-formyltetrahydrofolate cyclo-ligase